MKVVILDRDGVINVDSRDYIKSPDEWKPIPGSIEAISLLANNGIKVYVATNQAGVARGLFSSATLDAMHQKMHQLVRAAGGEIQGVFYCPHHPKDRCYCRKPNIGLLVQIADDFGESLSNQPFVGDSVKDIEAAKKMGCRPVLVKTGNGQDTLQTLGGSVECYDDLLSFARSAIRELGSSSQP
ncbi:MAG: D-glycero-beta-D-manno-heptose 1,7-bisphosphate 7-phosphatase [bacterium]|nr:D-glycero-beta-D-manno-heptose 1,7-bisphosphate 7-phosphatase [Gammaproteobacteria bacterium]HIL96736.1 D-glycero-beta-D-manno-heptose 1,7-bisphosphate 7-phosphatase [Pseudomonadales bacterium]